MSSSVCHAFVLSPFKDNLLTPATSTAGDACFKGRKCNASVLYFSVSSRTRKQLYHTQTTTFKYIYAKHLHNKMLNTITIIPLYRNEINMKLIVLQNSLQKPNFYNKGNEMGF